MIVLPKSRDVLHLHCFSDDFSDKICLFMLMILCGFWKWGRKNWEGIRLNQPRNWKQQLQGDRMFGYLFNVGLRPTSIDRVSFSALFL